MISLYRVVFSWSVWFLESYLTCKPL